MDFNRSIASEGILIFDEVSGPMIVGLDEGDFIIDKALQPTEEELLRIVAMEEESAVPVVPVDDMDYALDIAPPQTFPTVTPPAYAVPPALPEYTETTTTTVLETTTTTTTQETSPITTESISNTTNAIDELGPQEAKELYCKFEIQISKLNEEINHVLQQLDQKIRLQEDKEGQFEECQHATLQAQNNLLIVNRDISSLEYHLRKLHEDRTRQENNLVILLESQEQTNELLQEVNEQVGSLKRKFRSLNENLTETRTQLGQLKRQKLSVDAFVTYCADTEQEEEKSEEEPLPPAQTDRTCPICCDYLKTHAHIFSRGGKMGCGNVICLECVRRVFRCPFCKAEVEGGCFFKVNF